MCLVWADTTDIDGDVNEVPLEHVSFGKNSTITISNLYEDLIKSFKTARFWQIEITSAFSDLFIITAPKKPKIEFID